MNPDARSPSRIRSFGARASSSWRELRRAWGVFTQNRLAVAGLVLVALFGLMTVLHPILLSTVWDPRVYDAETGYDAPVTRLTAVDVVTDAASQIDVDEARFRTNPYVDVGDLVEIRLQPAPPSRRHLLGTDFLGRDVLSMVMASATPTFILGLTAALATAIVGTVLACLAAYYRRAVDAVIGQVASTLLLLPAPVFMVVIGARYQVHPLVFGLLYGVVAGAGPTAIVLRSHALAAVGRTFIEAARAAGGGGRHIIGRHLIPHVAPLAAAHMFLAVTGAVVADGFLAWTAHSSVRLNWGVMIFSGLFYDFLTPKITWHLLVSAALAISLFCAAFYLVSLGLRDVADRRLQQRR